MQRWLEPPVQVKASYQEAGLMRHGVVEGMAPLGTMPKVGIFKKAAAPVDQTPTRKIILKRPASNTTSAQTPTSNTALDDTEEEEGGAAGPGAEDGNDAMEGQAWEEQERVEVEDGEEDEERGEEIGESKGDEEGKECENERYEDEMGSNLRSSRLAAGPSRRSLASRNSDQDWAPAKAASPTHKNQTRRSLPRASTGRSGSFTPLQPAPATPTVAASAAPAAAAATTIATTATMASTATSPTTTIVTPSPTKASIGATATTPRASNISGAVDKIVEIAVTEALDHFRYPTAWALRTLYDENSDNVEFLTMVEEVYSQTAAPSTIDEFARLIHKKKKEGKKHNKGCYYFVPPSTTSRFTPRKPRPAPYSSLVRIQVPELVFPSGSQSNHHQQVQDQDRARAQDPTAQPQGHDQTLDQAAHTHAHTHTHIPTHTQTRTQTHTQTHTKNHQKPLQEHHDEHHDEHHHHNMAQQQDHSDEPARKKRRSIRHTTANTPSSTRTAATRRHNRAKTESPLKRKTRAHSMSSSSSLSSVRSMTPPDGIGERDAFDVPPSPRTSPPAEANLKNNAPAAPQPIASRRRSNQAKKTRNVSPSPTHPSHAATTTTTTTTTNGVTSPATTAAAVAAAAAAPHHHHHQPKHPKQSRQPASTAGPSGVSPSSSMPAAVDPPLFPNLSSSTPSSSITTNGATPTAKKGKGPARSSEQPPVFPSKVGTLDENDARLRLRQKARNITNGESSFFPQSFSRDPRLSSGGLPSNSPAAAAAAAAAASTPAPRIELNGWKLDAPHSNTRSRVSLPAGAGTTSAGTASSAPALNLRSTRSSRKRQYDEMEENASPTPLNFAASEAASTAANSRAGTPSLRPAKKTKTGLRVKTSYVTEICFVPYHLLPVSTPSIPFPFHPRPPFKKKKK